MSAWLRRLIDLFRPRRPVPTPPVPPLPGPDPAPPPTPLPSADPLDLIALFNAERAARGLDRLLPEYRLSQAAGRHAGRLAASGWQPDPHTDVAGRVLEDRMREVGYPYGSGEIIAPGFPSAEHATWAFMNESGLHKPHRDAILSPRYREVGAGVAHRDGVGLVWVAVLGTGR